MDYSYLLEKEIKKATTKRVSKRMLMGYAEIFRNSRNIKYSLPIVDILDEYHLDGLLNLQIMETGMLEKFECEGLYSLESNTIYISENTYNGAKCGNPRDRFTLTHEFAHYLLLYVLKIKTVVVDRRIMAFENPEWQANYLASELLAPTIEMMDVDSIYYIEDVYEVSNTVARIAYKKGKIQKDILENPYSLYKKRKWIDALKNDYPNHSCECMIKYRENEYSIKTVPAYYDNSSKSFFLNKYYSITGAIILKYAIIDDNIDVRRSPYA